jgi:phosphoglycolate/pyridoxal phosphate phosphatase family enzyme
MDTVTPLDHSNIANFLDGIDTLLLDCDGVLWRHKDVIPGVPETLKWLRSLGKRVIFVTNNSTESREGYKKKIESFGIECKKEEIWGSSYMAANYLKSIEFTKKAYIIGQSGIADELAEAGISYRGVEEHAFFPSATADVSKFEVDEEIGAIVVGLDTKITYSKVAFALLHLQSNPDCHFVATNPDNTFPSGGGRILPGGGTMVRMVEYCSQKTPVIVGKPSQWFLDQVISTYNLDRSRTIMVGDKLSTDILFGNQGNIKTLLVFTGVTEPAYLQTQQHEEIKTYPTYTADSFPHVMQYATQKSSQ